jgi:hypothetical protein
MKIPKSADKDFKFLVKSHLHDLGVGVGCDTPMDSEGVSAIEAWFMLDTHGKTVPCREPKKLDLAISGKASWNLQIKQWATDLSEGCILRMDELVEYTEECPKWVLKAVVNQAKQIARQTIGFVPTYIELNNN